MASSPVLISTPVQAKATLVLAHGAGAGMRGHWMDDISDDLTNLGWRIVRFEFPYMARRSITGRRLLPDKLPVLLETYRSVVDSLKTHFQSPLLIGGKSMGGRIATLLADSFYKDRSIQGVVCLGYPFHSLKKPGLLRTSHLRSLLAPTLIVQGERDPMGGFDEVQNYALSAQIQIRWIPDGDHSFSPRKRSGLSDQQNLRQVVRCADAFMSDVCSG